MVVAQAVIAVSSFRPFAESPEIARNQARAFESWLDVFDSVLYFGAPEPCLASPCTQFVEAAPFPPIRLLMLAGALAKEPVCLVNADIVLSPYARDYFKGALIRAQAAMSYRLEFDPLTFDLREAKRRDNGLDVFLAKPAVWRRCWRDCPQEFRIGRPVWDSWLFMWMHDHCGGKFVDLSAGKLAFHPKHSRT